jgi:ADP-ribosylglycohydrolase
MILDRVESVRRSALWAAYADALGFISELTDGAGLHRRLSGQQLSATVTWERRIGGRSGVPVQLIAGTYSDDTQLRLATCRAIGASGDFDVEAFSKVELPVWPSYALGGGRATKTAATNLAKPGVKWFANHYYGWSEAGGNGAAMRVQPHVWAAFDPGEPNGYLVDVFRNAVSTHGHAGALLGAALHAVGLGRCIIGDVPSPDQWMGLLQQASHAIELVKDDPELSSYWLPAWERGGGSFDSYWKLEIEECGRALTSTNRALDRRWEDDDSESGRARTYRRLLEQHNLFDPKYRGSGLYTSLVAMVAAWIWREHPAEGVLTVASVVGSDTDTIGTMVGALLGPSAGSDLPGPLLDSEYIASEAAYLAMAAQGRASAARFSYPDLLHWNPPRSQSDAVGLADKTPALAGLGSLTFDRQQPVYGSPDGNAAWQWGRLDFGQTILVKHRVKLPRLEKANWPVRRESATAAVRGRFVTPVEADAQLDLGVSVVGAAPKSVPANRDQGRDARQRSPRPEVTRNGDNLQDQGMPSVDQLIGWLRERKFDDAAIGYTVRRLAETSGREELVALTTSLWYELRLDRPR